MSEPPFESLDFALLRDADRLAENERRLGKAVGFDRARLFQAKQVHGKRVLVASGDAVRMRRDEEADAIVAERGSGVAVAVRVADCVPVLLGDPWSGIAAAVHAGWRGVVAEIVAETIAVMRERGAGPASSFSAAIGPCIGPCCFEVGADVAETIARATVPEVLARSDEASGKAFVDLRRAVRAQLVRGGLADDAVEDVPDATRAGCTRCNPSRFYSYRRDGDASGRLVGVIVPR